MKNLKYTHDKIDPDHEKGLGGRWEMYDFVRASTNLQSTPFKEEQMSDDDVGPKMNVQLGEDNVSDNHSNNKLPDLRKPKY